MYSSTNCIPRHVAADATPADTSTASRQLGNGGGSSQSVDDNFDFESVRLTQDFAKLASVEKVITAVPCRKPHRQEFIRVHAAEDWQLATRIYEDVATRKVYVVDRAFWQEFPDEIIPVLLRMAITRNDSLFVWPLKLPREDGRTNQWNETALAAANIAETDWVRVAANMEAGAYEAFTASGDLPEPEWPDKTFDELLRLAFKGQIIRDGDHPVFRGLRGER